MARRTLLLATVGAGALMAGMASQAQAFEVVDWTWDKTVNVTETITVTTNVTINFNGLVEIEKWQISFGDIHAKGEIKDIRNNPSLDSNGDGFVSIDETLTFNGVVNDDNDPSLFPATVGTTDGVLTANLIPGAGNNEGTGGIPAATPLTGTYLDEGTDEFQIQVHVTGEIPVGVLGESIDAVDLPGVKQAITAVANNQSITTTTALQVHDLQIAAGDINPLCGGVYREGDAWCQPNAIAFLLGAYGITLLDNQLDGINEAYDMAALVILGAATGFIDPADIKATAKVRNITNAFVDNAATAVGNNASFTINASIPGNAYFIGDVTQLLIGDVTAKASVKHVDITNYTGFGAAGFGLQTDTDGVVTFTPIVSNVATAVGNNLSINVNGCTVCAVPAPTIP